MWRGALADFALTPKFVVAEGDKVANYWTISGTHRGELMGVPATGKRIETYGMSLVRIEGGKAVEIWSASDQLGLMRTLGVLPS
jgi:predicted ester cyclase